jgi:hypothetical protein
VTLLVALAAAIEAGTGFILIVQPSALVWLLLGADLSQAGQALGRIAGFALLSLGWACWPQEAASRLSAAPLPLLIYNLLVTIYLAALGIGGELVGMLLWPAVAIHAVLSIILVRTSLSWRKAGSNTNPHNE